MERKERVGFGSGFAMAGTYGFSFVASVVAMGGLGYLVDGWLELPRVCFTLGLGLVGAVAGFVMIVRASAKKQP